MCKQTPGQVAYEALLDDSLRCPCDQGSVPLCVRGRCLLELAAAAANDDFCPSWLRRGRTPPPTWHPQGDPHG